MASETSMATPRSEFPDDSPLPASWLTGSSPPGREAEMAGDPAQLSPADEVINSATAEAADAEERKKTAWKNSCASNGVMTTDSRVMGGVSWPALSEASSMASARSSSSFLNGVSHGTSSAASKTENDTNSSSSSARAPMKEEKTKDHGAYFGSAKAENGGSLVAGGGTAAPAVCLPENGRARNAENGSRRGGGPPQAQGGNEFHRSYSGNRRRGGSINNGGWGGANRNNPQNWRGHGGRSGYDWNRRPFAGADGALPVHHLHHWEHSQARAMAWPFHPRHIPHSPPPFIPALPPVPPPFVGTMGYYGEYLLSMVQQRMPPLPPPSMYYGPPHALVQDPRFRGPSGMLYAAPDLQLRYRLTQQIDYYFSENNLSTDEFLRKQMDEQGWVSLYLIADFKRVKILTNNIIFISDAVRASTVVELEGSKIRRRNDWMRWPSLRSLATPSTTGPLTNSFAAMALDEGQPNGHHSPVRSSLGG